jgi:hypothetical protein
MQIFYGINATWVAVDKEKCRITSSEYRIPFNDYVRSQRFQCDPCVGVVKLVKIVWFNDSNVREVVVNASEECVFTDSGIVSHNKSVFDWIAYLLYNVDVARHYSTREAAEEHWVKCGQFEGRKHAFSRIAQQSEAKLQMLLSCNMKDEKNALEWLQYHFAIGFSQILLFDDYSNPGLEILEDKFPNLIVVRQHSIKHEYMSCALQYAQRRKFDYIMHLDADEYLYIRKDLCLSDLIVSAFPTNVTAIYVHWLFFGSSALERNPKNTLLDVFTKSEKVANPHIKALVRPNCVDSPVNPHTFNFITSISLPKRTISNSQGHLIEDDGAVQQSYETDFSKHLLYIAHYHDQSWEDHIVRHVQRYRDDTGHYREYSQEFRQEFDRRFNDVDNLDLANKAKELKLSV